MEPSLPEKISETTGRLVAAIATTAMRRAQLEMVRADRASSAENISDAANGFRRSESEMNLLLSQLIDLQVQGFHEALVT